MSDRPVNSAEFPEILPDFLDAVRSPWTGQLDLRDRNDRPHYEKFIAGIVRALAPANALEQQLAFSIAADYWRLNRTRNIEEGIFALSHPNPTGDFGTKPINQQIAESHTSAFLLRQSHFKFLSTYEMRLQRTVNRNKAELKELQSERRKRQAEQAEQVEQAEQTEQAEHAGLQTAPAAQTAHAPNGFAFSDSPAACYPDTGADIRGDYSNNAAPAGQHVSPGPDPSRRVPQGNA